MKSVRVGLLGLGTVGSGTITVLQRNRELISGRAGRGIDVVAASARDLSKPRECDLTGITLCADPRVIVEQADIDVVVELIGGTEIAKDLVCTALQNGKHVVTANKALIALHGNEIFSLADDNGVMVAFEAAVAGGIPIIKATREALAANRIECVAGIINGTCNYILSAMADRGADFSDVLSEAQELGYAEADPSFDINGTDAAHKLTILAAIAFGMPLRFKSVYTEGIEHIERADVEYAQKLGYRIKHLGIAQRSGDGVELRVHPTLVPTRNPLANIAGVMNAVMVIADAAGPTLYYGAGAGAEPTSSAVIADLVDIARAMEHPHQQRVPQLGFHADAISDLPVLDMSATQTAYYLRLNAVDRPGVLAEVTRILGARGISIEAILQQEPTLDAATVPVVILTHHVVESAMTSAIVEIEALDEIDPHVVRIRLEPLR